MTHDIDDFALMLALYRLPETREAALRMADANRDSRAAVPVLVVRPGTTAQRTNEAARRAS